MSRRTPEEIRSEFFDLADSIPQASVISTTWVEKVDSFIAEIQSEARMKALKGVAEAINGIILDQSDEDASWSMRGACFDIVVRLIEAEKEKSK